MVADAFDDFIQTVLARASRRGALGMLLGGGLAGRGLSAEATRSIQCRTPCGQCFRCREGRCCTRHGRKRCRTGRCVYANDAPCDGDGRCLNGVCNPKPTCGRVFDDCSPLDPSTCCSGRCFSDGLCNISRRGEPCYEDPNCSAAVCIGYRCQ